MDITEHPAAGVAVIVAVTLALVVISAIVTKESDDRASVAADQARQTKARQAEESRIQAQGTAALLRLNDGKSSFDLVAEDCDVIGDANMPPWAFAPCRAAHADMARRLIGAGRTSDAAKALDQALLEGLDATKAAALRAEIARTEKRAELAASREREKQAAEREASNARNESLARKAYGAALRERFLNLGMDVKVRVSGRRNDRIVLQWVLFNDVWTHKMTQPDGVLLEMKELGFRGQLRRGRTMSNFLSLLLNPAKVEELEPEHLAGFLLEHLQRTTVQEAESLGNFVSGMSAGYLPNYMPPSVEVAVTEAWWWLVREGLIVEKATSEGWYYVSRRGKRLKGTTDLSAFIKANILPKKFLDPAIAEKVWSEFARGEYETAVFAAFKEVEVAVRIAAGLTADLIGVPLMRRAFNKDNGPLTDMTAEEGERDALAHLFAGAIGSYKNPTSHRRVKLEPEEAAEMIILASHLMRIVDSRRP